ncbi:hypothetical protein [Phytoactinopolyspora mesophila]|uniref:Tetratricopeptide repeat protein n=1 Tax=Phytoactinopolyspora mesophila TaxID=2650750 RepID=A0A7K3M025_9ACTN|nr:hypothetical protein [Phytoactinopolyspora mesophila]NDL56624.1 hypothetical protein [Phytoactinopolyspora mesophila]
MLDTSRNGFHTLYVERSSQGATPPDAQQSIDLSLGEHGSEGRVHIQVKSVEDPDSARPLGANEALRELVKLCAAGSAERYELITNRPLSRSGRVARSALEDAVSLRTAVPESSDLLDDLTAEELNRLHRCRITLVEGTTSLYRQSVSAKVRAVRAAQRLGTGPDSSALLTGYLVDKVFQSAAGISSSRITRNEVTQWLNTSPQEVAAALGEYDWGNTIGSWPALPLLPRPERWEQIRRGLARQGASRRPARFVLRGPSGIGKSSIAAEYAYANHDQYAFMAWINGEDADSLRASFSILAESLSRRDDGARPLTPDVVSSLLSQHVGRWLLIIDNAVDTAVVESWLPQFGDGDILVTTLDSTSWSGRDGADIEPLTPAESADLLARFLPSAKGHEEPLARMASHLGHWPLALAMAAAYINGAQMPLAQATDQYLRRLLPRVVDDNLVIPEGYPRTLADAIFLAVDGLADGVTGGDGRIPVLARATIYVSSFFAENDIPLKLLLAATCVKPEDMVEAGHEGPTEIIGVDTDSNDMIRLLRRRSLLQRRARAVVDGYQPYMSDCISVNTITQLVLRSRLNREVGQVGVTSLIARAAYHVDQWLKHFIDNERFNHVLAIAPHAASIARHAKQEELASFQSATLAGNLALAYRSQGRHEEAASALEYQLAQISVLAKHFPEVHPDIAVTKTTLQLLDARTALNAPLPELVVIANSGILALERALTGERNQGKTELGTVARSYESLLQQLAITESSLELDRLINVAAGLATHAPTTEEAHLLSEMQAINDLLTTGENDAEAAARARSALHPRIPFQQQIQLVGLLGEALTRLHDFGAAALQVRALDSLAQPREVFADEVVSQLNNMGIATYASLDKAPGAVDLLAQILELSEPRCALIRPGTLRMHHILRGALAHARHDVHNARDALRQIEGLTSATREYGVRADNIAGSVVPALRYLVARG